MIFYYCIYAGSLQACRWLLSIVMHSRGLFIKFPAGCWYVLKCEIVSEEVLEIPPCDWGYEMNTKFLSFECLKTHQPSYFNFIGCFYWMFENTPAICGKEFQICRSTKQVIHLCNHFKYIRKIRQTRYITEDIWIVFVNC